MQPRTMLTIAAGAIGALALGAVNPAFAEFPERTITLIVPTAPGGSHDITARAIAAVAEEHFGQSIRVELKPGGSGAIGSDLVANAEPDGYTIMLGGPSWNTTPPALEGRSKGPDDFQTVARINYTPTVVSVNADTEYDDFKGMLEWAKNNPNELILASVGKGSGTDLFWRVVAKEKGLKFRSVPYEGGGAAMNAVIAGHAHTTNGVVTAHAPYEKAGKVWYAVITDDERNPDLPDVPTAIEEGIDFTYVIWRGILAPKDTPREIVDRLAQGFKDITEDPKFLDTIGKLGDKAHYLGPDEFAEWWRAEFEGQKALAAELQ